MALSKPKTGDLFLVSSPGGLGAGEGSVAEGTEVTVSEIHPGDEQGVGGDVVIEWVTEVIEIEGKPHDIVRRAAFTFEAFAQFFTKAGASK